VVVPEQFAAVESVLLKACRTEDEWPAQVVAGVYAAIDYVITRPELADTLVVDHPRAELQPYKAMILRLASYLEACAPADRRLPESTDEALIGGMVGLVGDHLRLGHLERLRQLRPEIALLILLPYLGFSEAQEWTNRVEKDPPNT
jgi:hypothetical protein